MAEWNINMESINHTIIMGINCSSEDDAPISRKSGDHRANE